MHAIFARDCAARRDAPRAAATRFAALLPYALLLGAAAPAGAATFTVGAAGSCSHSTLAAALTAAEQSPGPDTIRLTRNATWTQQAIVVGTAQELTLTGGFAGCGSAEDGLATTLDGSGGAAASVMRITLSTGGFVTLRKLTITGGDVAGNGRGGGIRFEGNGRLDLAQVTVSGNRAGFGGGISAQGTGAATLLNIGDDTFITSNIANFNGGGLVLEDLETEISGDPVLISNNEAQSTGGSGGYGGGISLRACERASIVYLGSPGFLQAGVVSNNTARYGGGLSIEGVCNADYEFATAMVYSTDAQRQTTIESNIASIAGGGVYLLPNDAGNWVSDGASAVLRMRNASILDNTAPQGSAIQMDSDGIFTGDTRINVPTESVGTLPFPGTALPCPIGGTCGRIAGNTGAGRVIGGEQDNRFDAHRIQFADNQGSELIRLSIVDVQDSLIVRNQTSARLIESNALTVSDTTITDNTIGAQHTLSATESPYIDHLIHAQPATIGLNYANDVDPARVHDIISNEIGSFTDNGINPRVIVADPRFVDAPRGDYTLAAASAAVDFAAAQPGATDTRNDLHSRNRSVDLPIVANRNGPRDLGAFERQQLDPLLYNGNFAVDLNHWGPLGESAWDGTQNAPGSAGGSARVTHSVDPERLAGRVQCFWLPGPGDYFLNGSGRVPPGPMFSPYRVRLQWEVRHSDLGECGDGTPAASGSHTLSGSLTWTRPSTPALIAVSAAQWTRNSSLAVKLVVDGGIDTVTGWFDDITLTTTGATTDGLPFRDGFED